MRALTVDVQNSAGRVLCCTIFRQGGRKLLAKGHVVSDEDILLLETEGMQEIWVTELEEGEVGENDAVMAIAKGACCGSIEIRLAAGGRANLFATENCCILVDDDLLKQINCTSSIVIATVLNYRLVRTGERLATIKSAPFAVAKTQLLALLSILQERGPIIQGRPIRDPHVAVLYTDPVAGDRARVLFGSVARTRIEKFGGSLHYSLAAIEQEEPVTRAIQHLLRTKPAVILVASTLSPAGPEDVIGRSLTGLGAHLEKFMAPVEPGNLLILSYKDDIPIVSAPGCFHSSKANILDILLPPLLARYRISGWEVACLGHGSLFN